ncbi:MAG: response regulator [Bacteroidota bacterium]
MIRPHKIIIVEDNQADAELTKLALKEIPITFEIVHLKDGNELIQYLNQTIINDIAVVLLDLNMPSPSGKDLLRSITADDRLMNVPVVIFSSSSQQEDIQECYSIGANAYVKKPVDVEEFQKAVKAIALFWLEVNVLPTGS